MLAKAKGAVLVLDRFSTLTRRIYLFGTNQKLKMEFEEIPLPKWFIILPESNPRMTWNLIVLCLLLYTATFVPYRVAFSKSNDGSLLSQIELYIDAMYVLDLYLNFFMAYEDEDRKLEIKPVRCVVNYLKTWFFLDFLSCLPFQLIEPQLYQNDAIQPDYALGDEPGSGETTY
jgi:hypothetical protein